MDFRIVQLPNIEVYGLSMAYAGPERSASAMEKTRHKAWSEHEENFPAQICEGAWNQPGNHAYDGVWYGIWQDGKYMIAREGQCVKSAALERRIIHAGAYAAFKTQRGALAWEALPKLYSLIFDSWLPSSNYTWTGDVVLERLHLWTDQIARREKRYYELLIPVSSK